MAQKRASHMKRLRENEKRQRAQKKADKAAEKRQRRLERAEEVTAVLDGQAEAAASQQAASAFAPPGSRA